MRFKEGLNSEKLYNITLQAFITFYTHEEMNPLGIDGYIGLAPVP